MKAINPQMYCSVGSTPITVREHIWNEAGGRTFCVFCGITFEHWQQQAQSLLSVIPLRDFFAAHALEGLLRHVAGESKFALKETYARLAFELADAMLAERSK
jgi:hypothetical protein